MQEYPQTPIPGGQTPVSQPVGQQGAAQPAPQPVPPSPPRQAPQQLQPVPPAPAQPPRPQPVPPAAPQQPRVRYTYTHAAPPIPQKKGRPMPQPTVSPAPQRVYSYQQPRQPVLRPMTAQPQQAPITYKMVKKKSKAPLVLGIVFAAGSLLLGVQLWPGWPSLVSAAVCGAIAFAVAWLLTRNKQVAVPVTQEELARMEAERRAAQEQEEKARQEAAEEASVIPPEAREYLRQMRQADIAIQDEAVSEKIRKLEARTSQIFQVVSENPEKLPEIRKFMSYYLPTLVKLLRSYDHLEEQGVEGDNIRRTMQEIERILDTVVEAFDKQLDNLFETEALDISSDIHVLETMLSQEGLIQQDFFKQNPQPAPSDEGQTPS